MIYSNKLNASFINDNLFNVPGCRRIFFMPSANLTGYALKNRQVNTISTVSGDKKFSLFDNLEGLVYTVKPETSKNGTIYNIEVSFTVPGIKADTKYILELLSNTEAVAIIEDENNRFWLLGYSQGLISTYEANSDESAYNVKMSTKQLVNVEEVSYELMNTIQFNATELTLTPDPINLTPVTGGNGSSKGGNVFNTVTVTTNNYQVQNSDHFIKSASARTVLLPVTPLEGQSHIFKATYDASVTPFIIRSASYYIDGNSQVEINTAYGSIEVVFSGNAWYTTAFVV